jgi:uncharacterized lipoprotein YddW (UPF0748 family)
VGSLFLFALSMFVAYYFIQGLRAWFLFINSVVFAFILPLSWLRFFWVHPPDVGRTRESVQAFVEHARRAHIETIIVLVKGMSGEIYCSSRKFPQSIVKGYESFDMLGELTREAHRHGIKVHAWLCEEKW